MDNFKECGGDSIGVGVIGLGKNGEAFVREYLDSSVAKLVAICDKSGERAELIAKKYGVKNVYTDYTILDREDIGVISIHTPDHLHAEPFVLSLQAGKHVFVEKPMADNISDLEHMVDAAREGVKRGLKTMVGQVLRQNEYFKLMRNLVQKGILGDIFYVEADYIHDLSYQKFVYGKEWHLEKEDPMIGGGIHPIDILRWIMDTNATEVQGFGNHLAFPEMSSDDCEIAIFKFANGCIGKVTALYGPIGPRPYGNNLSIYGTKGTIVREKIVLSGMHNFMDLPPVFQHEHPYKPGIEHFVSCIREDKATLVDAFDAANSASAVITARKSLKEKKIMTIPQFQFPSSEK